MKMVQGINQKNVGSKLRIIMMISGNFSIRSVASSRFPLPNLYKERGGVEEYPVY